MSNPPPIQPPSPSPLDYLPPQPNRKNSAGRVIGRIAIGVVAGIVCCILGVILAAATNVGYLFFLPLAAALALAAFIAIRYRRIGYVTGLIIAPFILTTGIFLLLLIICGLGSFKF
jgi:hypothetical protein